MGTRTRVLVFAEWYAPGYKAGGPITSVVNFVSHLRDQLDIYVFTTDRDLGDTSPYPGIETNKWLDANGFRLFYASPALVGYAGIRKMISEVRPDVIYLNSMFSLHFTILPLLISKLSGSRTRIVLSPRGMLRSSALSQKPLKKKIFLSVLSASGMVNKVHFHATDKQEMTDVRKIFGNVQVSVIGNLPGEQAAFVAPPAKEKGKLTLVFVGRVHPIKNLLYLLECLKKVTCGVELLIVGPVESPTYWASCSDLIREISGHVRVTHFPDMAQQQILGILRTAHAFVLPTTGENFGHAIFEALSAGRPVLISDQTPWKGLEARHAGWDIPLSSEHKFVSCIEALGAMDQEALMVWCKGAWQYCRDYLTSSDDTGKYMEVFAGSNSRTVQTS